MNWNFYIPVFISLFLSISPPISSGALNRLFSEEGATRKRAVSPIASIRHVSADDSGTEKTLRQLERAREIGFNNLLLHLPDKESPLFWPCFRKIVESARRLGLSCGFMDYLTINDAIKIRESLPRWSIEKRGGVITNLSAYAAAQPPLESRSDRVEKIRFAYREEEGAPRILRIDSDAVLTPSLPTRGVWQIYSYTIPVLSIDITKDETEILSKHVNQILVDAQRNLPEDYGLSLLWYCFPGASDPLTFWYPKLPLPDISLWSRKEEGLWQPDTSWTIALQKRWRLKYINPVCELVQESGLDASIEAEKTPLPPEEIGAVFKRPIFSFSNESWKKRWNSRVCGGARTMEREQIYGKLTWPPPTNIVSQLHDFPWKAPADSLFLSGATRILIDFPQGLPSADAPFLSLKKGCAYLSRCQMILSQTLPDAEFLYVGEELPEFLYPYSIDRASSYTLTAAQPTRAGILFRSGKRYQRLILSVELLKLKPALLPFLEKLDDLGVEVSLVSEGGIADNPFPQWKIWRRPQDVPFPPRLTPVQQEKGIHPRWICRKNGEQRIIFMVNDSSETGLATFRLNRPFSGKIDIFNPENKGHSTVPVQEGVFSILLEPEASCFLLKQTESRP